MSMDSFPGSYVFELYCNIASARSQNINREVTTVLMLECNCYLVEFDYNKDLVAFKYCTRYMT